jgi:hypothetical protein
VRPILAARCCRCHGPERQQAGLRLDSASAVRKGGTAGAVVVPGDAADSVLIAVLTGAEDRPLMPPSGRPLDRKEIALLRAWIDAGAAAPPDAHAADGRAAAADHWAFRPPAAAPVPAARDPALGRNPVDAFLGSAQEKRGLTPAPPVGPSLLLRRAYVDLIGMPPTREELRAFLDDPAEDAYEKAVDRLLASPQYGERWARHWMDVWRYSDADGRKSKKEVWWSDEHVWRWRDWIVRSLNADMGYDRMVVEMLAGDEAAPGDAGALAATGFLVRNRFILNRNVWLNNTVEHTGKAFLGLTLNCARCHDHKFDPVSQKEYYRFRAFFEPHDVRSEEMDVEGGRGTVTHAYDARPEAPTFLLPRGDERAPDRGAPLGPGTPAALGPTPPVRPVLLPGGRTSTGRRLALARWICDPQNPLTARVAVNHIWEWHFGTPLVESVADFGLRCPPPARQDLLDWLAVEWVRHGWSMKWLHRLIVTSATYRRQSSPGGATAADRTTDPDNRCYWRTAPRRMEAEAVRDALLCMGGNLDLTRGGPPLDCLAEPAPPRRSLYFRYSREDRLGFLVAFDAAGVEECYRRQESIVPQQALALENSAFVWDQARRIARRLEGAAGADDRPFVTAAFEHVLSRRPTPEESEACLLFLAGQRRLLADPEGLTPFPDGPGGQVAPADDAAGRAREGLIHVLLNHNDFITVR